MSELPDVREELRELLRKLGYDVRESLERVLLKALNDQVFISETYAKYLPETLRAILRLRRQGENIPGARRIATVMFVDVVGFTTISESLDAEIVVQAMNRIFTVISSAVVRHGGSTDKYIGDAVLATFGAPISTGDDPRRALQAALEIIDNIKDIKLHCATAPDGEIPLEVSIGINTGNVVAGTVGAPERLEYTVMGDTVNVASRLRDLARPGEIILSLPTRNLVANDYSFTPIGAVSVKGRKEPVQAFLLGKRIQRLEHNIFPEHPFFGRVAELAQLDALVDRLEPGKPGMCVVSGEAGIGKTRLITEWLKAKKESETWVVTAFFEERENLLSGILQALRSVFRIPRGHGFHKTRRRIAAVIRKAGADKQLREEIAGELNRLFDSGDGYSDLFHNEEQEKRLFRTIQRLTATLCRNRPVIIVWDNYQWLDAISRRFVEWLNRQHPPYALFQIPVVRTPDDAPMHLSPVTLELDGLGKPAAEALVRALYPPQCAETVAVPSLLDKVGDNPLFIELFMRHLRERFLLQESITGDIPMDLHGLIQSRVDRLGQEAGDVLQAAAVQGRRVSIPLLARTVAMRLEKAEQHIDDLAALGFFTVDTGESFAYFTQDLIREVVYAGILLSRRRILHDRIADIMEKQLHSYPPETIAFHLEHGTHPERAVYYLELTALHADHLYQYDQAIQFYRRGLDILNAASEHRPGELWRFNFRIGNILHIQGRLRQALEYLESALSVSREIRDDMHTAETLVKIADIHTDTGELEAAIPFYEEAATIYGSLGETEGEIYPITQLGTIYTQLGQFDLAEEAFARSIEKAESGVPDQLRGMIYTNSGIFNAIRGDNSRAIENFHESVYCFEAAGRLEGVAQALHNLGMIYENRGQLDEADYYYEQSLEKSREIGDRTMIATTMLNRGQIRFRQKDYSTAAAFTEQALKYMKELENPIGMADAYRLLGLLAESNRNFKRAQGLLAYSLRLNSQCKNIIGCAVSSCEYGRILVQNGRTRRGRMILEKSLAYYKTLEDESGIQRVQELLSQ